MPHTRVTDKILAAIANKLVRKHKPNTKVLAMKGAVEVLDDLLDSWIVWMGKLGVDTGTWGSRTRVIDKMEATIAKKVEQGQTPDIEEIVLASIVEVLDDHNDALLEWDPSGADSGVGYETLMGFVTSPSMH